MSRSFEQTSMAQVAESSPASKRRKTESGIASPNSGYDSANDNGDDLFRDMPSPFFTQPAQKIAPPSSEYASSPPSKIQVPASSPFRSPASLPTPPASKIQQPSRLASAMAPAGTVFRQPNGIVMHNPQTARTVIDLDLLDDEGPAFKGSSDDETSRNTNIKPSVFYPRGSNAVDPLHRPIAAADGGRAKFSNIMASSVHKVGAPSKKDPIGMLYDPRKSNTVKEPIDLSKLVNLPDVTPVSKPRVPDAMAAAYGGRPKPQLQSRPERPKPVEDISIDDITDYHTKEKIIRLQRIFPACTVLICRDALLTTRGNFDDAAQILVGSTPTEIGLPELPGVKTTTKRGVDNVLSIKDRYGVGIVPSAKKAAAAAPPSSSPPESEVTAKPKRRLMQGRKNPSPLKPASKEPEVVNVDSDAEGAYDSGVASQSEVDTDLEGKVLRILNKCEAGELVDLAGTSIELAEKFLAHRPFRNLDAARDVCDVSKTKSGKASKRAPIGTKIVKSAIDMTRGYDAVDNLVNECNRISKPLKAEMSKWGFDVFGASKSGELELTSLNEDDDKDSIRDSGIGTPSSVSASLNGEVGEEDVRPMKRERATKKLIQKPANMSENITLKDYQVVGLNWLALLYKEKLSCILADEMGLGKTCQVIAFISYLATIGVPGPHLVIVPGSTLENWLREFAHFSPCLRAVPYRGKQNEREQMGEDILAQRDEINVVVTTYDMAVKKQDTKFLKKLNANVCVYDEGHLLKNPASLRYKGLVKIPAEFRLLLTGTPLQNNLQELAALLAFILPNVFSENEGDLEAIFSHRAKTTDSDHSALLSAQRVNRARQMLAPFVLRRKKYQVLKHLPTKTCRVEYCDLHPAQKEIYDSHTDQARERAKLRLEGAKVPKSNENNPIMQLRKAAIHAQLFRRHFDDEKIEDMATILQKKVPDFSPDSVKGKGTGYSRDKVIAEMKGMSDYVLHHWCLDYPCIKKFDVEDRSWLDSGKVQALIKLVQDYKANGDRVLIFSQFSLVLDILEAVMNSIDMYFTRIDGSTSIDERQTLIDRFRDDETTTAFLLTTKAGGTGLNLMMANKVIIFDSSFNPQDDVQAENRAHRVGQTRDVEVVRLVTKGTIEEQILKLGQSKLALDRGVAGDESGANDEDAGEMDIARMLLEGEGNKDENAPDKQEEGKGKERVKSVGAASGRKQSIFLSQV